MTTDNVQQECKDDAYGATDVCALIISRLDGTSSKDWPGGDVYTYGSGPQDVILVPLPTRTTILVARGSQQRWFEVDVREVHPTGDPATALLFDPEILAALSRRAGNPAPIRWL